MPSYPDRPHIGVGAIVLEDNSILLVKRKYPPRPGFWSVPGGHVKLGERIEDAAVRELEEETGLRGRPLGVVNLDELVVYDETGRVKYHYILVDVLVDVLGGELRPGSDAEDARFFKLEEAYNMNNIVDSVRGLIGKILGGRIPLEEPFKPVLTSYTC